MEEKTKIKNCMKYLSHNNIATALFSPDTKRIISIIYDAAMMCGYKLQGKSIDRAFFERNSFQKAMYICGGKICFDYITDLQRDGYKIIDVETLIKKFKLDGQENYYKIEYSRKNNMVIATVYDGRDKYIKHAIAICSPQDTFDFEVGKKIARDRLFGIKNENK